MKSPDFFLFESKEKEESNGLRFINTQLPNNKNGQIPNDGKYCNWIDIEIRKLTIK